MLKIVATINDFGSAANLDFQCGVERTSFIIDVPTNNIPDELKTYFDSRLSLKQRGYTNWSTITFSLLEE